MDEILKQVAVARRRLSFELFLARLWRCLLVAFAAAAIAVVIPKLFVLDKLPPQWSAYWLGGAAVAGLLTAIVWTSLRSKTDLDAAMEIDSRFDLRERVASTLSLGPEDVDTPSGQALAADARRAVSRIVVAEKFRLGLGPSAWLPVGPALIALAIAVLVDDRQSHSSANPLSATLTAQQLDNTAQAVKKKLEEQRKKAADKGLKEAEQMLLELEKRSEQIADRKNQDPKQALVKLNDFKKQLEERQQALGGDEQLRKQLNSLKDLQQGPADKMLDAMKQGDWQQAKQELSKLQQQLAAGKLDAAGQKKLEQQVAKLQQKLEQAAAERRQAMEDLKKQVAEQKKKGNLAQAGKLQQKLDQLAQQQQQSKQMEQMAKKLGAMQQSLKKGDQKAAAQAAQEMMEQLEDLKKQMAEGEMLDMAMDQLEQAKDSMTCKECQGAGCQMCQGKGNKPNGKPGSGMGQGRGFGARPEEKTDTAFRDSLVKQNTGKGAATIAGEADGPTIRGEVQMQLQQEMDAQGSQAADPQTVEQLPKTQRENAEDYFNKFHQ